MRIGLACGRERLEFEVPESKLLPTAPAPPALADPAGAVRAALEAPFHNFPPLRRALTPDDHLAVLVDEQLPGLGTLLVPVLDHVLSAGVAPERVTLLLPPGDSRQEWVDDLPDEFQEVRIEVHDPADRRRLCYLATTAGGKRLYLNRTLVEADQVIALTGRRYDPVLGHGGAEGAIYPALGDEETRREVGARLHFDSPDAGPWPAQREAQEVAWLLGLPFFVQCIAGPGDTLAHVLAGTAEATREGRRLLDASWRRPVARPPDTVVVSLAGEPSRHTFADLAGAVGCAARVVQPDGRIVLLTRANPHLGPASELLRHDDPKAALGALGRHPDPGHGPALQWARAACRAKLSVLSDLPDDTVEELFATPLEHGGQVQRLLDAGGPCLFLEDAHKTLAVVE